MQGSKPKTVEAVIEEYRLLSKYYFTCARIVHSLSKFPIPKLNVHPKAWNFYTSQRSIDKGISFFYEILQSKNTFQKTSMMLKWERDLHASFCPLQWQTAFQAIHQVHHALGDDTKTHT